jgi:hypothetical protein
MAPVLQCPDCGTKHPLPEVPKAGAFPCRGCGRVLKVPEMPPRPATTAPPPAPVDAAATRVAPIVEQNPQPAPERPAPGPVAPAPVPPTARGRRGVLAPVPWWMRLLLWIVAIPLGFVVVFGFARVFGIFTGSDLSEVFLASGSSRFWPVVRLLPFVAVAIAVFVQAGVYLLARLRGNRA